MEDSSIHHKSGAEIQGPVSDVLLQLVCAY